MLIAVFGRCMPDEDNSFGKFEFGQAKALNKHSDCEVIYCCTDNRSLRTNQIISRRMGTLEGIDYIEHVLPCGGAPWTLFNRIRSKDQINMINEIIINFGVPDVFYAHFPSITLSPQLIDFLDDHGIPLVCIEHWTKVQNRTIDQNHLQLLNRAVNSSACFLCVSDDLARAVSEECSCEEETIKIVPNMVSDVFTESVRHNGFSDRGQKECFTFLAAGRLVRNKNYKELLEAINALRRERNIKLMIAGEGPERRRMTRYVAENRLERNVSFLGWKSEIEMSELYRSVDAYVSASLDETFCVPFAESWICGTPSIGPKSNPLRKQFHEGRGLLFDENDRCSLTETLRYAVDGWKGNTASNKKTLSEWAESLYSEKAVVESLLSIFSKV